MAVVNLCPLWGALYLDKSSTLVSTHSISSVTKSGCLLPPSNRTMSTTGGGCDWCHRGRCASRTALETVLRTDRLDTRHNDHKSHQVKLGKAKRVDRNAH